MSALYRQYSLVLSFKSDILKKMLLRHTYKLHTSVLQCIDAAANIDFGEFNVFETLFAEQVLCFLLRHFVYLF